MLSPFRLRLSRKLVLLTAITFFMSSVAAILAVSGVWAGSDMLPAMQGQEAIQRLKESGNYDSLLEALRDARQKNGPDGSCSWAEQAHSTASDGAADDQFGYSVAISGDTAIVGAWLDNTPGGENSGSAYVFTRSGTVWSEQQKLTASDGATSDNFGISVAISGDTAIVGAFFDDTARGFDAGSAYVFTRSGTVWSEQQKLTASDGSAFDNFGVSVAISGDTAIVGAYSDDTQGGVPDAGSAYVFTRGGTVWSQQQKLTASDAAAGDLFGRSVAISGDTAIVSAFLGDTPGGGDAGSAFVFTRTGTVWSEQQKLTASDGAPNDLFGISVAISGDTVIVGAHGDDTPGGGETGSAYVFTRTGTVWSQQQKLTASDGAAGDNFGFSVAISGDTAIVGAYGDNTPGGGNAGSSYIFNESCPTPATFQASSFFVVQGRSVVGGLPEIAASDNTYLSILQNPFRARTTPAVQVQFDAFTEMSGASSIEFRVEANTSAVPPENVTQRIDLFNFSTGQWTTVSETAAAGSDFVHTGTVASSAAEYLEAGTGRVRSRVSWFDPGTLITRSWRVNIDHVTFAIFP